MSLTDAQATYDAARKTFGDCEALVASVCLRRAAEAIAYQAEQAQP